MASEQEDYRDPRPRDPFSYSGPEVDLCGKEEFMGHSGEATVILLGRIYALKKYLRATAQAWIPAGVTSKVQHASFTALPPCASEDVMVCAHIGTTTCASS